jgi:hypothetical protein
MRFLGLSRVLSLVIVTIARENNTPMWKFFVTIGGDRFFLDRSNEAIVLLIGLSRVASWRRRVKIHVDKRRGCW